MHEIALKLPVEPERARHRQKRKRPALLLLGCLILIVQGCSTTPPAPSPSETAQAQAKAAYLANDYQRTLAIVEPMAIAGEAWAQYTLGYMYHYGRGVAMDRQMSKQWIERAAQQGYVPAQEALQRISLPPSRQEEEDKNSSSKPQPPDVKDGVTPPVAVSDEKKGQPNAAIETTDMAPVPTASTTVEPVEPVEPASPAQPPAKTSDIQPAPPIPPASVPTQQETPTMPAAESPMASTPPQAIVPPPAPSPSAIPPSSAQASAAKPADDGIKGRDWIVAQDPNHYTVQLIGSSNEAAVIRFIHKHGIEKEASYYSTTHNGKPWFSVLYGNFPSLDAARQAAKRLPPSLRNASPWLRSFSEIHTLLNP
jgi:septal ring-binding cell division protein DamX